jgi:ABC-2 type transport system permease protein
MALLMRLLQKQEFVVQQLTKQKAERVVAAKIGLGERFLNLFKRRDLLALLIAKELSVKYKNSVLGFAWSMLNPALMLAVWYFIFQVVLGSAIQYFAIYLMSGLLAWNFFASSVQGATTAVVENGEIVKKVAFPRELLVIAKVGQSAVFFLFQAIVLAVAMAVIEYKPSLQALWLVIPAFFAAALFGCALGLILSALNVYYRDIQHFVEIALFAWFFAVPVVYSYAATLGPKLSSKGVENFLHAVGLGWFHLPWLYLADPIAPVILSFSRAIYGLRYGNFGGQIRPIVPHHSLVWFLGLDLYSIFVGLVLFLIGLKIFSRMEANFAEEL